MTVRQLGIFAPYTWDASTGMACVLAEMALSWGVPVSYLAYRRRDTGVDAAWDSRVLSVKKRFFESWASKQSHLIWFDAHKKQVQAAKRLGCHNTLVLFPSRISQASMEAIRHYDQVVCPTHCSYTICHFRKLHSQVVEIPWDSGLAFQDRLVPADDDGTRVLVLAEGEMTRDHAPALVQAIGYLLESIPRVSFTVCHHRNWSRTAEILWKALVKDFPSRLVLQRKPSRDWRLAAYQQHHWFFYPRLRDPAGFFPLESLAVNCPVLAFNLPPVNEFVRPDHNGYLISCPGSYNWFGVPQGNGLSRRALVREMESVLALRDYHRDLRERSWRELPARRQYFTESWRLLWELRDDKMIC